MKNPPRIRYGRLPKAIMKWIDLSKTKPPANTRVLVCDENGYVDINNTEDEAHWRNAGYPVADLFDGRVPTFEDMAGTGYRLVAWVPLPEFPETLCRNDADGELH